MTVSNAEEFTNISFVVGSSLVFALGAIRAVLKSGIIGEDKVL